MLSKYLNNLILLCPIAVNERVEVEAMIRKDSGRTRVVFGSDEML